MEVYFVRHGETYANVLHRHQPGGARLTERGREQARSLAERVAAYTPSHLITSSQVRAVETARIMVEQLDFSPETSDLFQELVRPKSVMGYPFSSFKSLWYMMRWYFGFAIGKESESYEDLMARIDRARQHLESFPDDARIVVVSHAVFINFFLAHVCRTKALTLWAALRVLSNILSMPNTAVVELRYKATDEGCGWQVLE